MEKPQAVYPTFTNLTCEKCDGLGFLMTDDIWRPKLCECMKDAPKEVEPFKKD
mgnify:FL=1